MEPSEIQGRLVKLEEMLLKMLKKGEWDYYQIQALRELTHLLMGLVQHIGKQ